VAPIDAKDHWGLTAIQGAFTVFVLLAAAFALIAAALAVFVVRRMRTRFLVRATAGT
jgi:hypothetical protein